MQFSSRTFCFIISLLQLSVAVLAKVRGNPGVDFPNFSSIPKTSFKCPNKGNPEFYADFETRCQVFHYCYEHRKESFLCPEGTIFNKAIRGCDYWYSSDCDSSENSHKVGTNRSKKNMYNDAPLVPVRVQTNNIFDKMAALYEPKELQENSLDKEQEDQESSDDFVENGNESYNMDSGETDSLWIQKASTEKLNGNYETREKISDFEKYDHDSLQKDDVEIVFHDSFAKSSSNENDNNEAEVYSEADMDRYQETDVKENDIYYSYNSDQQKELLISDYPQSIDNLDYSDIALPESLLVKRLSDDSNVQRKKIFRRKPTYVVLQTKDLGESSVESVEYNMEENQPTKNAHTGKTNVYQTFHTSLSPSDTTEVEKNFEEGLVQMPVRKLRRNRKKTGMFANESEKVHDKAVELIKENPSRADQLQNMSHKELLKGMEKVENKSNDITTVAQKPKRNRKNLGVFIDEPNLINVKVTQVINRNQASNDIYVDKTKVYNSSQAESLPSDTMKNGSNFDDIKISDKFNRNIKTLGTSSDKPRNVQNDTVKPLIPHKEFVMPVNIMSPSFETDLEPILVSQREEYSLTTDILTTQPTSTQETGMITTESESEVPNKSIQVKLSVNDLENSEQEINSDDIINITSNSEVEERVSSEIGVTESTNSGAVDLTYLKKEINHDSFLNMSSNIENRPDPEHEINTDHIKNNSEFEDLMYSEQEIISDGTVNHNSNTKLTPDWGQKINSDDLININQEGKDLPDLETEINYEDIVTPAMNDHSYGTYNDISIFHELTYQHDQNNYKIIESKFSEDYNNLFSKPIETDSNNQEYIIISTLSPLTTTDDSSGIFDVLDEDNAEQILYENPNSFENEQMSNNEYKHIHYDNVQGTNNEYAEEKTTEIFNDLDMDISDEREANYLPYNKLHDLKLNDSPEIFENIFVTETSPYDVYLDDVENSELNDLEGSSVSVKEENLPVEETLFHQEWQTFSTSELPVPSGNIMEISNQANIFYTELFESFAELNDTSDWYKDENSSSVTILEELSDNIKDSKYVHDSETFVNSPAKLLENITVTDNSKATYADKYRNILKIPKKSFGSSTIMDDSLNNEYGMDDLINDETDENGILANKITESFKDFGEFGSINQNMPLSNIKDAKSADPELVNGYSSTDDEHISKKVEQNGIEIKASKNTLFETDHYHMVDDSDNLNIRETKTNESALNQVETKETKNRKSTVLQTGFLEQPHYEEEKPIETVFHSSSIPLPANIFEQGLYKQSLKQEGSTQYNKDNLYPVTFYKELDDSFKKVENKKFSPISVSNNKKYRSLNSGFQLGEMSLENVGDLSSKYHEPSILSLFEPSQAAKKLLSLGSPILKSKNIFSSPFSETPMPIKLKKLASFGKNLLAFKRAKLANFNLMFNSLIKEI